MTRTLSTRTPALRPQSRHTFLLLERLEDRTVLSTTIGGFDPVTATWYLRNSADAGVPDAGQFQFGPSGAIAVVGDWNGDGQTDIGAVDPVSMTWYLRYGTSAGLADAGQFQYGGSGWTPIVGDWNGDGATDIGVVDPVSLTWYLRSSATAGAADAGLFQYGGSGWTPVVGDWDADGDTDIGAVDPASLTWYLRSSATPGAADAGLFQYGGVGSIPITGDWDGDGGTDIGVFVPGSALWLLRKDAGPGIPDAGQFQYGGANFQPVTGDFTATTPRPTEPLPGPEPLPEVEGTRLLALNLNPLDLDLLGLKVQTSQITVTISAREGDGALLGNVLTGVSNLINFEGVNAALNNVLASVVGLVNSVDLEVSGVLPGTFSSAEPATTTVLDLYVAPIHLDLLGVVVDTSPIELTITATSGEGLVLGNVVSALANLFNPPLPQELDLDTINARLQQLLAQLNEQIPGIGDATTVTPNAPAGSEQILALTVPPIDLNLLGLVLQTSQIQVNADAVTGDGKLLGNVLTTLLNTLEATPEGLDQLNDNLNALLAKVVGVLNAATLTLPDGAVDSLSQVLQTLALPDLINQTTSPATTQILDLVIASPDGSPPVNVDLLGLVITTSNIDAQLLAETGEGQVLGNLLYNVANLLNPGGPASLLTLLTQLGR